VGGWDGTVELAETVTVNQFSVGIARSRVVRRNDSAILCKVPRNQEVMVDPVSQGLPGIYGAELRMSAVHPRSWSKVSVGIIVDSPSCRKERR
jgi:hypothetical protein